jgi:hypothetical protein
MMQTLMPTEKPLWKRLARRIIKGKPRVHAEMRWSRVVMEREIKRLIAEIHPENLSACEIAGETYKNCGWKSFERTHYPQYDVCSGPLDKSYDAIIANQVFEHLLWPYRAAKNVFQSLSAGGYFIIATPFLVRVHNYPIDCSRWTELGLKHFLAEAGFPLESTVTGSWGNRQCVIANLDSFLTGYIPEEHSLHNEPDFPYHVWARARKTAVSAP